MAITYFSTAFDSQGTLVSGNVFQKSLAITGAQVGDRIVVHGIAASYAGGAGRAISTIGGSTSAWSLSSAYPIGSNDCEFVAGHADVTAAGTVTVQVNLETSGGVPMGIAAWLIPAAEWSGTPTWTVVGGNNGTGQLSVTVPTESNVFLTGGDWNAVDVTTTTLTPSGGTLHTDSFTSGQYQVFTASWAAQAAGTRNYGLSTDPGAVDYVMIALSVPVGGGPTQAINWRTATGLAGGTTTAVAWTLPTGVTQYDLLIPIYGGKPFSATVTSGTVTTNYTERGSVAAGSVANTAADVGSARAQVWTRVAGTSESAPAGTVSATPSPRMAAMLAAYATIPGTGDWTVQSTTGADSTLTGTSISATGADSLSVAPGDVVVVVSAAHSDSATESSPALSIGSATFDTPTEQIPTNTTTSGTDGALYAYSFPVTGAGSGTPTFTATSGGTNQSSRAVVFLAIKAPSTSQSGAASIVGTGSVSAASSVTIRSTSSITGAGNTSATATVITPTINGTSSVVGSGATTANGASIVVGSASVIGTGYTEANEKNPFWVGGSGNYIISSGTVDLALPSTIQSNDLGILTIQADLGTDPSYSTPSGWTYRGKTGAGNMYAYIYTRQLQAGDTNISITATGSASMAVGVWRNAEFKSIGPFWVRSVTDTTLTTLNNSSATGYRAHIWGDRTIASTAAEADSLLTGLTYGKSRGFYPGNTTLSAGSGISATYWGDSTPLNSGDNSATAADSSGNAWGVQIDIGLTGPQNHTASIVGTGSVSASASVMGQSSVTGVGYTNADSTVVIYGSSAVTGVGSVSATGAIHVYGTAVISGDGSTTAIGSQSSMGYASIAGVGATSATSTISARSTVIGAGSTNSLASNIASATAVGSGNVSANAQLVVYGSASVVGTGATSATVKQIAGSTVIGNSSTTANVIQTIRAGSAQVGAGSVGATSTTIIYGSSSVVGSGSISANSKQIIRSNSTVSGVGDIVANVTQISQSNVSGVGDIIANTSSSSAGVSHVVGHGAATANAVQAATGAATGAGSITATPSIIHVATASIVGVGSTSAKATHGTSASSIGSGSTSGSNRIIHSGSGTSNGVGAVTAKQTTQSPALVTGSGAVVANATVIISATAQVIGTGLTTSKATTITSTQTIDGVGEITAKGTIIVGPTTVNGSGATTANIVHIIEATATVEGVGSVTATSIVVSFDGKPKIFTGLAWERKTGKAWDGTEWKATTWKRWTGSEWALV